MYEKKRIQYSIQWLLPCFCKILETQQHHSLGGPIVVSPIPRSVRSQGSQLATFSTFCGLKKGLGRVRTLAVRSFGSAWNPWKLSFFFAFILMFRRSTSSCLQIVYKFIVIDARFGRGFRKVLIFFGTSWVESRQFVVTPLKDNNLRGVHQNKGTCDAVSPTNHIQNISNLLLS